jgi:hypothetical protein
METGLMINRAKSDVVTRADLALVEVPERTASYRPIPYADAVDCLLEQMDKQLGLTPRAADYGLNKDGGKMFAKFAFDVGDAKASLSIGLRGAYDKSLSWKIGGGQSVLVCDNLCFSADGFVVMRKNTTFAWADYQRLVTKQVSTFMNQFKATKEECARLTEKPCNQRRGYAMIGVAQGEGILTSTQASVAFSDWKTPRYEDFADRNLWSLYNCFTEGLKKGAVGETIDRHANAHAFLNSMAAR